MFKKITAAILLTGLTITLISCTQQNSETLMTQLLEEVRPEADIESYEVFEEINSPNGENTAVLIRYQNESGCCSEPTGIFLIENGELSDQYEILAGALNHLALKNVEWETDTKASYDYAIIDEGGENSTKRYLELD